MANLGSFGAAVKELTGERDVFDFFGEKFEVVDSIPGDDKQFVLFYRLAVSNRADLDSLMALALALFEAQTGRPTEEPHGSSPGSSTTSPTPNTSSSPSPASRPLHPALEGMIPVSSVLTG